MLLAEASSAICVQRFDGSRNSAIHTTYRISLRSSSLREPRYPLLRVCQLIAIGRADCNSFSLWFCVWVKVKQWGKPRPIDRQSRSTRRPAPVSMNPITVGLLELGQRPIVPLRGQLEGLTFNGHRCGFDRFNDPSAGSPRVIRSGGSCMKAVLATCCRRLRPRPLSGSPSIEEILPQTAFRRGRLSLVEG